MKKAFTMIELVMVMVVMGIIASIGADIIASMYTNYIRSRTINTLEAQTEITLEQIAKRLQYRIKESTIARKTGSTPVSVSSADETYPILEWIGYSNESLLATPLPGWSGFVDLYSTENNSTASPQRLKTSESNLSATKDIMGALSDNNVTLYDASTSAGLIFKGKAYNASDFGWQASTSNTDTDTDAIIKVSRHDYTTFQLDENVSEIYEQYYLAHSAYAIQPIVGTDSTDFNLTLRYNYQPWHSGEFYTNAPQVLLAEHVSLFRFKQDDTIMQLKLCLHDGNSNLAERIVICKEKVVY